MNNKLENSEWDDEQIKIIVKFFSDIGWYPTATWNIKKIILDCVESEVYLCNTKKQFLITDISSKNIISILTVVDYDIRLLLRLCSELSQDAQGKYFKEMEDDEDKEEEKRLDSVWYDQNGGEDACDNCGWPNGRNHDCNSAMEGDELNNPDEGMDVTKTASVNYFIVSIANKFESMKEKWIKDGFDMEKNVEDKKLEEIEYPIE